MENLENVNQNQLTLFELLTPSQEAQKAKVINSRAEQAKRVLDRDARTVNLLLENGFVEGVHFKSNTKIVKNVTNINVGDYKNKKIIDIEVEDAQGCVSIIYDRLSNNAIVKDNAYLMKTSEGKLECPSITGTNRAYKPKSLLEKLLLKNEQAVRDFEAANKDRLVKEYTIEKYKALFPEAEIILDRDYTNYASGYNYYHFDILNIKFKSGSYITLRLGSEIDKEYIYKKYNVIEAKASIIDLLNVYNNQ